MKLHVKFIMFSNMGNKISCIMIALLAITLESTASYANDSNVIENSAINKRAVLSSRDWRKMERALKRGGCKVSRSASFYNLRECCSINIVMKSIEKMFESRPNANIQNIKQSTGNLIDPEKFKACGALTITESSGKTEVAMPYVQNDQRSSLWLPWLSIKELTLQFLTISIDLANDKEALVLVTIDTTVPAELVGNHFPSFSGLQVKIKKENRQTDMHYSILPQSTLEMSLEEFLRGIGVKPENMLDTLDFRIRGPIYGVATQGVWNVIINGDNFFNHASEVSRKFYSGANVFLFCQYNSEDSDGPKCSLNSQNIPGTGWWNLLTTVDMMSRNFAQDALANSKSNVFQSSKIKVDVAISTEIKEKLRSFSEISVSLSNGQSPREHSQDYISAGTCVRYLRDGFSYAFKSGVGWKNSQIPYIFNLCIKRDEVTITTLPTMTILLERLNFIVLHWSIRNALHSFDDSYGIIVENLKYIGGQTCATFKSHPESRHEFVKGYFTFVNSVITICGDKSMATIKAEGREFVLGAEASVNAKLNSEFYLDNPKASALTKGWFMTGRVKIFDIQYVLEQTGQQLMDSNELSFFSSFNQFNLKDTVFKAPSTSQMYLVLEGTTAINHKEFKFELVSRSEDPVNGINPSLVLCLRKEGGTSDEIFSIFYKDNYKSIPYSFEKSAISIQQDMNFYRQHQNDGTGIVLRCQNLEIQHEEIGVRILGKQAGSIRGMFSNLVFGCDSNGDSSKKSVGCEVIKNGFGGLNTLEADYYGKIRPSEFRLTALVNKPFIVADGIEFMADDLKHVLAQAIHPHDIGRLSNTVSGKIDLGTYQPFATINLLEDTATFKLAKIDELEHSFNIYGVSGISQNRVYKDPVAMSATKRWSYIELQGNIKLGTVRGMEIDIESSFEGAVRQFIYQDKAKYRFFACAPSKKEFSVSTILQAFGAIDGTSLFSATNLKEVCVAYHKDEVWNIESQGLKAKTGLRMYGTITSLFGYQRLKANIRLDGDVSVNVEMPQLKFGARSTMNPKTGKMETRHSFTMSKMKSFEDFGPTFSAIFNNQKSFGEGSLTGYIKLPMFEGQIKLNFDRNGFINQNIQLSNSESENTKIQRGHITVTGTLVLGVNMGSSRFTFSADLLFAAQANLMDGCQKEFTEIYKRSNLEKSKIEEKHTRILSEIVSLENQMLLVNGDRIKRMIQEVESKMWLDIREVKNHNTQYCKPLKLSGFKLEKSCGKRRSLQNTTCLKFTNGAFEAADTTCLEKTENIRRIAHTNALRKNSIIRASALLLREKRTCYNIFEDIVQHYKNAKKEIVSAQTNLLRYINILKVVGRSFSISVTKFRTPYHIAFSDIPSTLCLDFSIGYNVGTRASKNEKLCVGETIFDDLGKKIVKDYLNGLEEQRSQIYKDAIKNADKELYKAKFIQKKKEKDYEVCKRIGRGRKRGEVFVPEFFRTGYKNQAFHRNAEEMESMLNYFASWNVMKRSNPIKAMNSLISKRNFNMTPIGSNDPCENARNKIEEYGTIVEYTKTWTKSYQEGMTQFKKVNENVARSLKRHNMTQHQGYLEFTKETESQLNQLNSFAPSYMKNELNVLFNPNTQDDFAQYLYKTSTDANNLIKKSFLANDDTFVDLSNIMIQQFSGNKTLEELTPSVNEMEKLMSSLNKRSLICHDEL